MATGGLYGQSVETVGLYGNNVSFGGTYFEWFVFQQSATQPATPTGGSWNFQTNVGTPPTGWSSTPPTSPTNIVWASIAIVSSLTGSTITWTAPATWVQLGTSGFSGYSGKSGYSGYSGTNGASGTSGYSGYSGYSGSGISGYSGYSGSGTSGYSGFSGISGFSGAVGTSGYSGISGANGASGTSGYSGFSGISGYSGSGISGYSGTSGYSGSGVSGYSGYSGSGVSGYSGYSGAQGTSGYSGYSGSGISGYSGYSGYSGANGAGSGSVTSVAMTVPSFLSVTGSPITSSGTLAVTLSGTALPVLNGGTGVTTSTGTGSNVLSTSPTLITPALGTPSSGVVTNLTGTASININGTVGATTASTGAFTYISTSGSTSTTPVLTFNASNSPIASGATISGSYLQFVMQNKSATAGASTNYVLSNDSGTDSTYYGEFGINSSVFSTSTPTDFFSINNGVYFSGHDGDLTFGSGNGFKTYIAWGTTGQSAHVVNAVGALGLSTNLGTTPALSGTTGYGTSGQPLLSGGSTAAPSWGTLGTAAGGTGVTTSTGSGSNVLSTSPTLVTPILGTPTSATLTNATGLPLTTGVTGTLPTANGGTNLTSFTANGVVYASSTSALATGSALVFDGTNLGLGVTPSTFTGLGATVFESNGGATAYRGVVSGVEQYTNTYYNSGFLYKASGYATRFTTAGGAFTWYTAPSGTAGNAISFTQVLAVEGGKSLALQGATSQTGTGITFPATQSASSDANTLDDYEEGTWTPIILGSGTAGTPTYSVQSGVYTKIGRMVYVVARVQITAWTGSPTGNIYLGGLPFAAGSTGTGQAGCIGYVSKITFSAGYTQFSWLTNNGATTAALIQTGSFVDGTVVPVSSYIASNTSDFNISISYFV